MPESMDFIQDLVEGLEKQHTDYVILALKRGKVKEDAKGEIVYDLIPEIFLNLEQPGAAKLAFETLDKTCDALAEQIEKSGKLSKKKKKNTK